MAHYRQRFKESDKHLGAWDLWNDTTKSYGQQTVTIDKFINDVLVGSMGTEKKVFVKFKEHQKLMVINVTNFKRLAKIFDSVEEDVFIGKSVVLGVEKVKSPEGMVDALRFSTRPAVSTSTKAPVSDADFPKALASIAKGALTVDKLKATRSLSPSQLAQLDAL
jgi:hypothetical protein